MSQTRYNYRVGWLITTVVVLQLNADKLKNTMENTENIDKHLESVIFTELDNQDEGWEEMWKEEDRKRIAELGLCPTCFKPKNEHFPNNSGELSCF